MSLAHEEIAIAQTIQVTETMPAYFRGVGSIDAWRAMARQRAFEEMLQQIKATDIFQTRCLLSESWQYQPDGSGRALVIVCDLSYWTGDDIPGIRANATTTIDETASSNSTPVKSTSAEES